VIAFVVSAATFSNHAFIHSFFHSFMIVYFIFFLQNLKISLLSSFTVLRDKIAAASSTLPITSCMYDNFMGNVRFRTALADLMNRFMGGNCNPENLVVTAGASSALDHLFFCLCEAGDGIILPSPYYPAFVSDMKVREFLEISLDLFLILKFFSKSDKR
jgi:DNA-binding transcriptional MocR family regulator